MGSHGYLYGFSLVCFVTIAFFPENNETVYRPISNYKRSWLFKTGKSQNIYTLLGLL